MRILFFILAVFSCVFAEENFTEVPDVCTTEGLPSSIICGVVCAISGEYTESCTDMVVAGVEPLTIGRNYSSLSNPFWSFNHVNHLKTGYANDDLIIRARQDNGSYIDFCSSGHEKKKMVCSLRDHKGLTNASGCGRYYLKNMKAHTDKRKHEISIINGAGDKKRYKRSKRNEEHYLLEEFRKSNGFSYTYEHDHKVFFGLSKIFCKKDNRLLSSISIRSSKLEKGIKNSLIAPVM